MLHNLIEELYAHTSGTMDDILYIANKHGIQIDASIEGELTVTKGNESITFSVTTYDDGHVFIFDI